MSQLHSQFFASEFPFLLEPPRFHLLVWQRWIWLEMPQLLVEGLALPNLTLIFSIVIFEGYKFLHLFDGLWKFLPRSSPPRLWTIPIARPCSFNLSSSALTIPLLQKCVPFATFWTLPFGGNKSLPFQPFGSTPASLPRGLQGRHYQRRVDLQSLHFPFQLLLFPVTFVNSCSNP